MNVSSQSSMPVPVGRKVEAVRLQHQVQSLQRQIESVSQSETDTRTKADEMTKLGQQIQMIGREIQQQHRLQMATQPPQSAPAASAQANVETLNTLA